MECDRVSPLWRIFRGCGHSFHLECNLPYISVCAICNSLLESKAVSLGKTANNTVTNFTVASSNETNDTSDQDTSDDDSESSDDEDIDDFNEQSTNDERAIGGLISRIASWQHVQPPNH